MFNANVQNWFGMSEQQNISHHSPSSHAYVGSNGNITPANVFLRKRSVSNSNPSLDRAPPADIHVEYEVAVPIVSTYRHTPYHSLWDLHQW